VLAAAQIFVEESNPRDETFVLNFNDTVRRGLPGPTLFSDNIQQLRSALYRGVPEGRTALYDAVVAGLKQLEAGSRDKKALIVISDGGDTASEHTRRQMLELVERSTATIYAVGLFDADEPDHDIGILQRLSQVTGGESYFPKVSEQMVPVCRGIARNIRARYTIGYLPHDGPQVNPRRQVRVLASAPDHQRLLAHTRNSYWYDSQDQDACKED
jgi:Ca-activated chloride channel family protein